MCLEIRSTFSKRAESGGFAYFRRGRTCSVKTAPYGTAITSAMSPGILASSAAATQTMPTIYTLRKAEHSAARSAISSPSRSVAATVARCTIAAMKRHGGGKPALIRSSRPTHCGWKRIRFRPVQKTCLLMLCANGSDRRKYPIQCREIYSDITSPDDGNAPAMDDPPCDRD